MSKSQFFKKKSIIILFENILRRKIIIISCDSCRESSLKYRIFIWSRKCDHYIRYDVKYNTVEIFLSDFAKIEKKRFRINNKLRVTRTSLFENFVKINLNFIIF